MEEGPEEPRAALLAVGIILPVAALVRPVCVAPSGSSSPADVNIGPIKVA
jgi:hypothetical protein